MKSENEKIKSLTDGGSLDSTMEVYPNIFCNFVPVGSCDCKQSFSAKNLAPAAPWAELGSVVLH